MSLFQSANSVPGAEDSNKLFWFDRVVLFWNRNGSNCIDIDECSQGNGGCSQVCLNRPGNFSCECLTGYTLAANARDCIGKYSKLIELIYESDNWKIDIKSNIHSKRVEWIIVTRSTKSFDFFQFCNFGSVRIDSIKFLYFNWIWDYFQFICHARNKTSKRTSDLNLPINHLLSIIQVTLQRIISIDWFQKLV